MIELDKMVAIDYEKRQNYFLTHFSINFNSRIHLTILPS